MNHFLKIRDHYDHFFDFDKPFDFVEIESKTIQKSAESERLTFPKNDEEHIDDSDHTLWFVHLNMDEFFPLFGNEWKGRIVCRFSKGGDLITNYDLGLWKSKCCDLTEANCRGAKNEKDFYILHVLNHRPVTGDFSEEKAQYLSALCRLEYADAKYILSCVCPDGKTPLRVVFSSQNAAAGKHSTHNDSDYKALNLLFNKPANSDTLVAWYMLAKACSICTDEEKKKNLLLDRDAWKINDTWSGFDEKKAANAIKEDFAFLKDSWGLKFDNEQEIIDSLVEFARIIYGNSCSLDEDSINRVLTALQQVFSSKDTQKVNSSAKKNTTIVKRNDKAEKSKTSAKKTSSSKKTTKKGGK